MKTTRRITSLLLAVIMIVSMVPMMELTLNAATTYSHLFPVKDGYIAYYYGYTESYGDWHSGVDIHYTYDDTIFAACSGTVGVATDPCSCWNNVAPDGSECPHHNTYGNYIRINNDDGTYSYYGHLAKGTLKVTAGQRVEKGQIIASMGSSGWSTGKHLHYEVRYSTSSGDTVNTNPVGNGGQISYTYDYNGDVPATYTVSYNANGGLGVPDAQSKTHGTALTLSRVRPIRVGYDFLGWATDPAATTAAYAAGASYTTDASVTLYAVWKIRSYTITWVVDGESETTTVSYNEMPVHGIPGKLSDEQYHYTFTGWEPAVTAATADTTYTAIFTATERVAGESDWVLESEVPEGADIVSEKWVYTLTETDEGTDSTRSGWETTGSRWEETGSGVHYYANFPSGFNHSDPLYNNYGKQALTASTTERAKVEVSEPAWNSYIYWHWAGPQDEYDYDTYNRLVSDVYNEYLSGAGFMTIWYAFESTTDYPYIASAECYMAQINGYAASSYWWYRFNTYRQTYTEYQKLYTYEKQTAGLESATEITEGNGISNVQKYVTFSAPCTVTWDVDGVTSTETYAYGETPTHADPVKAPDAQYTYTFTGWTPAITAVTGDVTYTAQFDATPRTYTVTWVIDGVTSTETYAYGETPAHADPVKAADAQYTYTFTGWSPAITAVTGDVTYTAQFEATPLASPDVTVTVVDKTTNVHAGEVTIVIRMESEVPVQGYELALDYDTDVFTFISAEHFVDYVGAKYGYTNVTGKSGYPLVVGCALDYAAHTSGNIQLFKLTFAISDTAEAGEYVFRLAASGSTEPFYDIVNGVETNRTSKLVAGTVTLQEYELGDANKDGAVSIRDISAILAILATSGEEDLSVMDVNCDGQITIRDISALLGILSA